MLVLYFLQFFDVLTYFAPMDPVCQAKFDGSDLFDNTTNECNLFHERMDHHPPLLSLLVQTYFYGIPEEIFFLFLFSQCFAFWFSVFHPNQNKQGVPTIPYCCSKSCCCSRKPPYCVARFFCCLHFFGKSASSPPDFV